MAKLALPDWRSVSESLFEKAGKIKRVHRMLIFVGTMVLLGSGFFMLVYMPKSEEIAGVKEDVERLEQQIRTIKIQAGSLEKLRAGYAKVQERFKEALKLLPDKREIPNLLRSISEVGLDSNLEFRLFNPRPEKPKDFYVEIPVAIEVRGDYRSVVSFFDRVGRMDRIVNVLNISIKPDKPLSTSLITRCTAITYRFKGKSDTAKPKKKKK